MNPLNERIEVCLGCGNKLEEPIRSSVFYSSMKIFLCSSCKKHFNKAFSSIYSEAIRVVTMNKELNGIFDAFIEKEETKSAEYMESSYFESSRKLREYMFSLLEETHRFAYHSSFECYLYCEMFEEADPLFFSERYFLTNSAIKVMGAWEKIFLFFSFYYEIELDSNPKNNSFANLQKKLKKSDFKNTKIYKEFVNLKSNGSFNKIGDVRKFNDHNVSYHLGNNYKEMTNIADIILKHTETLYNGIEEALKLLSTRVRLVEINFIQRNSIITMINENNKVFKKKAQKIKSNFNQEDVRRLNVKSVDYIQWAEKRLAEASKWRVRYSSPPLLSIYYRLVDVTVRLHESARSLGFALEMFNEAVKLDYADLDKYWFKFDGMNYRYFIHSALIRIYSIYDKIAVIIQELFEIQFKKNTTLEKTIEFMRTNDEFGFYNSLPPFKIINRILSHNSYKKLYSTRQDFFHLLVMQDFMSPRYKEVLDIELIVAIIDNSKLIYELIDVIDVALVNFHNMGAYHASKRE
jgi:hypothetical protein